MYGRGLAREGKEAVSAGVPGEINQDVDAIGAYALGQRFIAQSCHLMPAIGAGLTLCRQRIGVAYPGIADEFKGLLVMMGEHGSEEKPYGVLAQIR